jgi:hypothetical protein
LADAVEFRDLAQEARAIVLIARVYDNSAVDRQNILLQTDGTNLMWTPISAGSSRNRRRMLGMAVLQAMSDKLAQNADKFMNLSKCAHILSKSPKPVK